MQRSKPAELRTDRVAIEIQTQSPRLEARYTNASIRWPLINTPSCQRTMELPARFELAIFGFAVQCLASWPQQQSKSSECGSRARDLGLWAQWDTTFSNSRYILKQKTPNISAGVSVYLALATMLFAFLQNPGNNNPYPRRTCLFLWLGWLLWYLTRFS